VFGNRINTQSSKINEMIRKGKPFDEIVKETGLPEARVHDHLKNYLYKNGYIEYNTKTSAYSLVDASLKLPGEVISAGGGKVIPVVPKFTQYATKDECITRLKELQNLNSYEDSHFRKIVVRIDNDKFKEELDVYKQYLSKLTPEEIGFEKKRLIYQLYKDTDISMGIDLTDRVVWNTEVGEMLYKGLEYFPNDILYSLRRGGYNIKYIDKKGGGVFHWDTKVAQVFQTKMSVGRGYVTTAHEMGHAVDALFAGVKTTGLAWKENPWVTKEDIEALKAEWERLIGPYPKLKTMHLGKDSYQYNVGNFVDPYDAKEYSRLGQYGHEWWTGTIERYQRYRQELKGAEEKLTKRIYEEYQGTFSRKQILKEAIELGDESKIRYARDMLKVVEDDLAKLKSYTLEEFTMKELVPSWERTVKAYPKMSSIVERIFGSDIGAVKTAGKIEPIEQKIVEKKLLLDEKSRSFIEQRIKEEGYTTDFKKAGFITNDGKMINISKYGIHGEFVGEVIDEDTFMVPKGGILDRFVAEGNIRIHYDSLGASLQISLEPTPEQYKIIQKLIDTADGRMTLDLRKGLEGETLSDLYGAGTKTSRVVEDIKRFYAGEEPLGPSQFSKFHGEASLADNYLETNIMNGKRVFLDGSELPEHIQKLRIPPAWTDVKINPDPAGDLLVQGKDVKGRFQSVYSDRFAKKQAEAKFARIQELDQKFDSILKQVQEARLSTEPAVKDTADCLQMIIKMGIRPGSEADTGAAVKAFGATTLQGKHVVTENGKVFLRFIGKKGVRLDLEVADKNLAKMLINRAKTAGVDGQLFPKTNETKLLDFAHSLDGGKFKTKDFRTLLGTRTAMEEIAKMPIPKNEKEYKQFVKEVATKVSEKLGNTPTVALESYINPSVFSEWRTALVRTEDIVPLSTEGSVEMPLLDRNMFGHVVGTERDKMDEWIKDEMSIAEVVKRTGFTENHVIRYLKYLEEKQGLVTYDSKGTYTLTEKARGLLGGSKVPIPKIPKVSVPKVSVPEVPSPSTPKRTWIPVRDQNDAIKQLKELYLIEDSEVMEGIPVSVLNRLGDMLTKIHNDMPIAKPIKNLKILEGEIERIYSDTKYNPNSVLGCMSMLGDMTLNPKYFSDMEYLDRVWDNCIRAGIGEVPFHPKGAGAVEGVISHEFGHYIDDGIRRWNRTVIPEEGNISIWQYHDSWMQSQINSGRFAKLSQYARTNDKEAFAEAFSAIYSCPKNGFSPEIQQFLLEFEEHLKKTLTYIEKYVGKVPDSMVLGSRSEAYYKKIAQGIDRVKPSPILNRNMFGHVVGTERDNMDTWIQKGLGISEVVKRTGFTENHVIRYLKYLEEKQGLVVYNSKGTYVLTEKAKRLITVGKVGGAIEAEKKIEKRKTIIDYFNISSEYERKTVKTQEAQMRYTVKNIEGVSNDKQAKDKVQEQMKTLLDNTDVYIRVDAGSLEDIFNDGRFLSIADTGTSGAGAVAGGRKESYMVARFNFEKELFGVPQNAKGADRPIYGYIASDKNGRLLKDRGMDHYGDVAVKLKKTIRSRTTITFGDSLDIDFRMHNSMIPSPIDNPSYRSIPWDYPDSINELLEVKSIDKFNYGYVEAQMKDVRVEDIEEVILSFEPFESFKSILKKYNIKWRVAK
jgi:DNA topoisomerase I